MKKIFLKIWVPKLSLKLIAQFSSPFWWHGCFGIRFYSIHFAEWNLIMMGKVKCIFFFYWFLSIWWIGVAGIQETGYSQCCNSGYDRKLLFWKMCNDLYIIWVILWIFPRLCSCYHWILKQGWCWVSLWWMVDMKFSFSYICFILLLFTHQFDSIMYSRLARKYWWKLGVLRPCEFWRKYTLGKGCIHCD